MNSSEPFDRANEVRMSELMTPESANFLGNVFGGAILAMLDKVAYVTASRYAGRTCVTASIDRVDFISPIYVGEVVHMVGRVVYVGRTSVQTLVEVYAEDIQTGAYRHTNSCTATLVAIDDDHKPHPVPQFTTNTVQEKRDFLIGRARRELAQHHREELQAVVNRIASMRESDLDAEISGAGGPL
jgi:acyl-CoA hydrolase